MAGEGSLGMADEGSPGMAGEGSPGMAGEGSPGMAGEGSPGMAGEGSPVCFPCPVSLLPSPIQAFPCVFPQLRLPRAEPPRKDSRCHSHSRFLIPTFLVPRMLFPLLMLALSLAGAMEIQVPEEPVVALFGHDATLRCSFSPEANFSVAELSLIWQLTDTKRLVHGFSGGRDLLQDQGRGYANRTSLFYDQLARGNVSLLLRRVEISDEGSFTCFVRVRDYNSAAVTLQVAAPYSKPSVHLEPSKDLKPGDVAVVTCHASRGYPEASVLWQDGRGANLTANVSTSQVANEEGLFEVRSVLRVLVEPSVTYSCLVLNAVLRQHGHASVTITGQPLAFPAVALWVTVALAVCVVLLLGVLAFVCHQKIRESCREDAERAGPEERDEEGEEPKTALQLLENTESREGREQEID
ncbi:CD276 antigen isoform X2 [Parus major]|uniref:CD276 antigen isoform X2 n=1 Tax=Parus major TaxID=9157 RepID=UPI0007711F02|nr:CD276 antigen isoform X2 [Parus major]